VLKSPHPIVLEHPEEPILPIPVLLLQHGLTKSSVIATLVGLILGSMTLSACGRFNPVPRGEPINASENSPTKVLQPFQPVEGTPYLVAEITRGESRSPESYDSSTYSSGSGGIRNLVFLESGSLASHRLFDQNQFLILEASSYPQKQNNDPQVVTQWFVYRIIKQDTDKNKELGQGDLQTLAISNAFGKQYQEVFTGISQWLGSQKVAPDQLMVVYIKDGTKTASLLNLAQGTVIKSQAISDLGPDVK
jgi:hypothetical protein